MKNCCRDARAEFLHAATAHIDEHLRLMRNEVDPLMALAAAHEPQMYVTGIDHEAKAITIESVRWTLPLRPSLPLLGCLEIFALWRERRRSWGGMEPR